MTVFNSEQRFIVTGASSGIGEAAALLLNKLGAGVIAIARNGDRLADLKKKCSNPKNMFIEIKDLSNDIHVLPAYVKSLKDKYGRLQGLVYCAGIVHNIPLQLLDEEQSKKLFDIDYFAPIFMTKGFADRRINNGRGSAVVLVASAAAETSPRAMSDYSGAKAALIASAKVLARELAPQGIRINTVSPADIETPMTLKDGFLEDKKEKYPLGFGQTDDVAEMIAYLLSDKAKWLTAQNYIIDCGSF